MKTGLSAILFVLLGFIVGGLAEPVPAAPAKWLEGDKGYKKALELQKVTKQPILVWATWHDCPHCSGVTDYVSKGKAKKAFAGYIRVIVDEHGKGAEAALAAEKGFHGGYFVVMPATQSAQPAQLWAWQPGGRVILPDLETQVAAKMDAASESKEEAKP